MLEGYDKFLKLRRYVLDALDKVDMSYGHKSYEGTFELLINYPNYFDEESGKTDEPDFYQIMLHCYVLGPNRHYHWEGKTLAEAVDKCYCDVSKRIKEGQDV